MTRLDKEKILAELRAEDVAAHLGIAGVGDQRWRGRWMRSRRCGQADHPSEAFGLARDGHWHCHACDQGGDLIALIAVSEGLDQQRDFQKVLEIAAALAQGRDMERRAAPLLPDPDEDVLAAVGEDRRQATADSRLETAGVDRAGLEELM